MLRVRVRGVRVRVAVRVRVRIRVRVRYLVRLGPGLAYVKVLFRCFYLVFRVAPLEEP